MKSFVINDHGRLVFPCNYFPDMDFSVFETVQQLTGVIQRDFEEKAPTGTEISERAGAGKYETKFDLLRDLALYFFWVNRYSITMYDKRPTRWRDVPRRREDVYIPMVVQWESAERKVSAVETTFATLPARWDAKAEEAIFELLFGILQYKAHDATGLAPIKATVGEFLASGSDKTFVIAGHDPDYPVFSPVEIFNFTDPVPELEALGRWARVLHNQYPWNRRNARLAELGSIGDDDFVVLLYPRNREVAGFIDRVRADGAPARGAHAPITAREPVRPYPPVDVRASFQIQPRLESLAVVRGEHVFTNDDVIRNSAFNWSLMSADEIGRKTGIGQRRYTGRSLDQIALEAATAALAHAGRDPEEIGAVLFCSCTSTRLIPSTATYISGQLGIYQTHASYDIVAACAGMPYGLAESVRLLQEIDRPVLLVCAEKFSDKIGSVRTSRMIFGDGAAAMVIGRGDPGDVFYFQTYASGPTDQVNSIIWPNPAFDNNITVYGPDVKALVERYLGQMMSELEGLPGLDGAPGMLESIDLIVPHQANKVMVANLAGRAGIAADRLYFNIEKVGNVSAASIPLAMYDAVVDGVVDRPMTLFTPGFGAGAVAGYTVLRLDPAVVAPEHGPGGAAGDREGALTDGWASTRTTSSEDVRIGFGT
ncbi:MAG: 3-oxoacyl-ACP synthase III family protein [Acidimicrobiales bacterium]